MSPATKTRLWTLGKILFAAGCVTFVVRTVSWTDVPEGLGKLGPETLLLLAALAPLHVLSLSLRWRTALRELGERVPLPSVIGDLLVGVTYNSLLPSTVGGDVVRVYRGATRVKRESSALASIALERAVGLVCLSVVPLVGLVVGLSEAPGVLVLVALGATAAFGLVLALLHMPFELAGRAARSLAPGAARFFSETSAALRRVGPLSRLRVAGWSLAYQALVTASFFVVATALGEARAVQGVLIGVPAALLLSTIPVTVGGLGVREGAFVAVLVQFGFSPAHAIIMSAVWALEWLVIGLLGAVVIAATRLRPLPWPVPARDR